MLKTNFNKFTQEAVMQDYASSGAFKDKRDAGRLHMFFSPHRVPLGLTATQIRICLNLAKLVEQREEAERKLILSQIPEEMRYLDEERYEYLVLTTMTRSDKARWIPHEFSCCEYMTEELFMRGISALLAAM